MSASPVLKIRVHPERVVRGGNVFLEAENAPSLLDNEYKWTLPRVDMADYAMDDEGVLRIDTDDLPPNTYQVQLEVAPRDPAKGQTLTARTYFTVDAAPLSRSDVDSLLTEFSDGLGEGIGANPSLLNALDELRNSLLRAAAPGAGGKALRVALQRSQRNETNDQALWAAIRNRTRSIAFSGSAYKAFVDRVLGSNDPVPVANAAALQPLQNARRALRTPFHGSGAYDLLKTATEVFLLVEAGAGLLINDTDPYDGSATFDPLDEAGRNGIELTSAELRARLGNYLGNGRLPYIERVLNTGYTGVNGRNNIFVPGFLRPNADMPLMLELIWSYWHEEGMLVQTMNTISLRFQNRQSRTDGRDPLAHLEIGSLYGLNTMLWSYIQDEDDRLSVVRRAYEYNHQYGLTLHGKAIGDFRPADTRSRFLEAYHNLLSLCAAFFKQDDDVTVVADGFPILNALRETHMVLAEGAHNQFGDLPWTARVEMLMQQWLLARPEMRDFLQSRPMVPYREEWMPQVDTMKSMQGWTDVSVAHFNYLATYGEQLLLSIRYGDWVDISDPNSAANWARSWRAEIQGYLHSFRAATGVDLTLTARDSQQDALRVTQPSELLRRRLAGATNGAGPAPKPAAQPVNPTPVGPPPGQPLPQAAGFRARRNGR